jgi:CTP synthase (UTP-ammonia lyase)
MKRPEIALVGEREPGKAAHKGIESSIALYGRETGAAPAFRWVPTESITPESAESVLGEATGVWCTPGSPYKSTAGALLAIRHARTGGRAFLGTCGGFQHALIEYARDVLGIPASHQELDPDASDPLLIRLPHSLVGTKGTVIATSPERFAAFLGAERSVEEFNCSFGVDRARAAMFAGSPLVFVAHDESGEIRAFRLDGHPFFVGTLFQPERRALGGSLHPVVRSFLDAAR